MLRRLNALAFPLLLLIAPARTFATGLSVRTIESGSWPAAVADIEANVGSEGRAIHVFVRDDRGQSVPCGEYTLSLDEIGAQAFAIGRCDPSTSATEVRTVHRSALFAHDDLVPTPLAAGISAVEMRTGGAAGGAGGVGGSEVQCSLAIRPFLTNMEDGSRVYLQPGRFVLRALSAGAAAETRGDAWALRTWNRGEVQIDYEVFDTHRNTTMLHDRATLSCASDQTPEVRTARIAPPVPPRSDAPPSSMGGGRVGTTCADAMVLTPGTPLRGTTLGGARRPLYRVEVSDSSGFSVSIDSGFGGELDVYDGCPDRMQSRVASDVFGGGPEQRLHYSLRPGIYYVAIVDADIHAHVGAFSLSKVEDTSPLTAAEDASVNDAEDRSSAREATAAATFLASHPECHLAGPRLADGVECRAPAPWRR